MSTTSPASPETPFPLPTRKRKPRREPAAPSDSDELDKHDACDPERAAVIHAAKVQALIRIAAAIGATLAETKAGTLVIRRGASSWHCSDSDAARAVLDRIKAAR